MWWLLVNGDAINSARVDRVTAGLSEDPDGVYVLMAWIDDLGYELAGQWASVVDAREASKRLTNALDPSQF